MLDPLNEMHLYALNCVHLPKLIKRLRNSRLKLPSFLKWKEPIAKAALAFWYKTITAQKKRSFLLRITSENVTISDLTISDLVTFTEEILNGKLWIANKWQFYVHFFFFFFLHFGSIAFWFIQFSHQIQYSKL